MSECTTTFRDWVSKASLQWVSSVHAGTSHINSLPLMVASWTRKRDTDSRTWEKERKVEERQKGCGRSQLKPAWVYRCLVISTLLVKCEPLIEGVAYLKSVGKPPTRPVTVTPHSQPSSVEAKDSVAPRTTFFPFNLRTVRHTGEG